MLLLSLLCYAAWWESCGKLQMKDFLMQKNIYIYMTWTREPKNVSVNGIGTKKVRGDKKESNVKNLSMLRRIGPGGGL